jgi:glycosyltransferase involved in cell wall biosynthesis
MTALHLLGSAADGGAETYFVDLTTALHRAGVPTVCALRRHPARELALARQGVVARRMMFGGPVDLITPMQVAAFARRSGAGALVAWMNRAARHAPPGPWRRIGRLGGYYKLRNYQGFDMLVANTAHIAGWAVDQGWPAANIRYIPNFAAARDSVAQDRAALQTPVDAPLLLTLGRLHSVKAQDVAIEALVQLPDAWLWIAGAGPLEAELKAQAARLGVADRVRFLGWREDAGALYAAADICLFPSRYEPLGNVVIQAWAHGLPIIAAASQGPSALIRDGDDGLLVPVDDAAALARAARQLIDDPALRGGLAANGRSRVTAEFSEPAVVAQWRELLASLGAA